MQRQSPAPNPPFCRARALVCRPRSRLLDMSARVASTFLPRLDERGYVRPVELPVFTDLDAGQLALAGQGPDIALRHVEPCRDLVGVEETIREGGPPDRIEDSRLGFRHEALHLLGSVGGHCLHELNQRALRDLEVLDLAHGRAFVCATGGVERACLWGLNVAVLVVIGLDQRRPWFM